MTTPAFLYVGHAVPSTTYHALSRVVGGNKRPLTPPEARPCFNRAGIQAPSPRFLRGVFVPFPPRTVVDSQTSTCVPKGSATLRYSTGIELEYMSLNPNVSHDGFYGRTKRCDAVS